METTTICKKTNSRVRLGYACINITLRETQKVNTNRTCRLNTALKAGESTGYPPGSSKYSKAIYDFLVDYGLRNTAAIIEIVQWHVRKNMRFYRLSSDIFPHIDNERLQGHMTPKDIHAYRNLDAFTQNLQKIAEIAHSNDIRLTMHPSPYAVLGSPDQEKVEGTVETLKWHARIYVIMEDHIHTQYGVERAFRDSILCLHIGGKYPKHGGKPTTLQRWKTNFRTLLPDWVKRHVAVENCEKNFSAQDLLPLAKELNIPLIFDFHHHDCYPYFHSDEEPQRSKADLLPEILETWSHLQMRPKFHLSDQAPHKSRGAHADFVAAIPDELITLHSQQPTLRFDLMIEAKMKDYAVFYLLHKYPQFNDTSISDPLSYIPLSILIPDLSPGTNADTRTNTNTNILYTSVKCTVRANLICPKYPLPKLRV